MVVSALLSNEKLVVQYFRELHGIYLHYENLESFGFWKGNSTIKFTEFSIRYVKFVHRGSRAPYTMLNKVLSVSTLEVAQNAYYQNRAVISSNKKLTNNTRSGYYFLISLMV